MKEKEIDAKEGKGVDPRYTPKGLISERLICKRSPNLENDLEIYSKVKVIIPLLNALALVLSYTLFFQRLAH